MGRSIRTYGIVTQRSCRIHDNEALHETQSRGEPVTAAMILDPAFLSQEPPTALRLKLSALRDLRDQLRARGSDLIIREGPVASTLPTLVQQAGATEVWYHSRFLWRTLMILSSASS
jgi:deoxyribodipyrimidine photo-lyase